jgi:hypothetical protein
MNDKFQSGSGVYVCSDCGKSTRETGYGESSSGLCAACFRIAEWENALSDGSIDEEEFNKIVDEIKNQYGEKKAKIFSKKVTNNNKQQEDKNMNTEQLRSAAVDLNSSLGLEPKINTRLPKEELQKKVAEAGELLEDGDKIQQNTADVLLELEVDVPAGVKAGKVKVTGTIPPGPNFEKPKAKSETAKPKTKEPKEKKESAGMNKYGFRIGSALGDASEGIADGKSKEEIIKLIIKTYGSTESAAEGRYKIALKELKKQGVVK